MIVKSMVGNHPNAALEQYIVETTNDLDEILSDASGSKHTTKTLPFGSIAFVLATKSFYMIGFDPDGRKIWVKISKD